MRSPYLPDTLILTGLALAERVRLARLARRWRQTDLVAHAQAELDRQGFAHLRVTPEHVSVLELGGRMERRRLAAVLHALGLESFNVAVLA